MFLYWNDERRKPDRGTVKIIFVDVDGTLVPIETHHPSPLALEYFRVFKAKGGKVCLATGRSYMDLGTLLDFPFDAVICSSGQDCRDQAGLALRQASIEPADIENLMTYLAGREAAGRRALCLAFMGKQGIFANCLTPEAEAIRQSLNFNIHSLQDADFLTSHAWMQLMYFGDEAEQAELMAQLPHCRATRWHPDFIDIMPASGGKSDGVRAVLNHLGLSSADAAAVGDGENDLDMLKAVAVPVAMGSASDTVKKEAALVTRTAIEDGLALALKEILYL